MPLDKNMIKFPCVFLLEVKWLEHLIHLVNKPIHHKYITTFCELVPSPPLKPG